MIAERDWVEVQPPVPRSDSLRARLSGAAWASGIETFFVQAIPFSYSTGRAFAQRITHLLAFALRRRSESIDVSHVFHVYEIGAGLGVLALHVLNILRERHPDLYPHILLHVTDISESILEQIQNLGVLDDHREHVRFEVVDALQPKIQQDEEPAFVIQSYMASSLPVRHVEVSEGEIAEILVRTKIPKFAQVLDTSTFPPRATNATTVVEQLLAGEYESWWPPLSQLVQLLHEEFVRVPIGEATMSNEAVVELQAFAATHCADAVFRFNYCSSYGPGLTDLVTSMGPDAMAVVHDFGWVNDGSTPELAALSTNYGAAMCNGVSFPYLAYSAEEAGASCRLTKNEAGESQVLLIDKQDGDDRLDSLFDQTFNDTGYDSVRHALRECTEIAETNDRFPDAAAPILSSLEELDRHDYALLLGIAWELLRRGFTRQAIEMAEQSLDGYQCIAVDSYLLISIAHRKLGELDLAQDHIKKAITICPDYPLAHAELGHLLLMQGKQKEHLHAALKSLCCHPDDAMWEQVVVVVIGLLVQGRTEAARAASSSILETADEHPTLVPDFAVRKLQSLQGGPFVP